MGDLIEERLYSCFKCNNVISRHDDIISKDYQSRRGRAYLLYEARNVTVGAEKDRNMISGRYRISDIFCYDCGELLGWRYIKAYNPSHKYKEGKVVLETYKITNNNNNYNYHYHYYY